MKIKMRATAALILLALGTTYAETVVRETYTIETTKTIAESCESKAIDNILNLPEGTLPEKVDLSKLKELIPLGWLSAWHESAGELGVVSDGKVGKNSKDLGGESYGVWQLSFDAGSLATFLISEEAKEFQQYFNQVWVNGTEFKAIWTKLSKNPKFIAAQHAFITRTHYSPVVADAEADGIKIPEYMEEAIFSASVQHGHKPKEGTERFRTNKALYAWWAQVKDKELGQKKTLEIFYAERAKLISSYYKGDARSILVGRYDKELKLLLALIPETL